MWTSSNNLKTILTKAHLPSHIIMWCKEDDNRKAHHADDDHEAHHVGGQQLLTI